MPHIIGILIWFIVVCLILGFCYWAFQQLVGLVNVSEPFKTLIRIALGGIMLAIVIWAIYLLAGWFVIGVPGIVSLR